MNDFQKISEWLSKDGDPSSYQAIASKINDGRFLSIGWGNVGKYRIVLMMTEPSTPNLIDFEIASNVVCNSISKAKKDYMEKKTNE